MHYHLQKTSLKRKDRSYTDSPEWLKNKKATINPKTNGDNFFQYTLSAALNYQNIKNNPERISNLKTFINQYNWKEIDFPSLPPRNWKKFQLNNKTSALNILFVL